MCILLNLFIRHQHIFTHYSFYSLCPTWLSDFTWWWSLSTTSWGKIWKNSKTATRRHEKQKIALNLNECCSWKFTKFDIELAWLSSSSTSSRCFVGSIPYVLMHSTIRLNCLRIHVTPVESIRIMAVANESGFIQWG